MSLYDPPNIIIINNINTQIKTAYKRYPVDHA